MTDQPDNVLSSPAQILMEVDQKPPKTESIAPPNDLPVVGQWYWVTKEKNEWRKKEVKALMVCSAVGSNHAQFQEKNIAYGRIQTSGESVMDKDMHRLITPEPEWREILLHRAERDRARLTKEIKRLADLCSEMNVLGAGPDGGSSMALVVASDPVAKKEALVKLRDEEIPKSQATVKSLTENIACHYKNLVLTDEIRSDVLSGVVGAVNDQLFALELYAGFDEHLFQIADGAPAPQDTPVTIRQMLRYMDEETLIAAEDGGMDFKNLGDFDKWLAANIDQVAPNPRCVVAFKIRRNMKDYGSCRDIATALKHLSWHEKNTLTYLIIRNGQRIYRLNSMLDFEPRLVALRNEFGGGLEVKSMGRTVEVGPADEEYDDAVKARANKMKQYNRILFIIQGLLDRSDVFNPHPRIFLSKPEHADQWIKVNHDEEDGLPSSNPPLWEDYKNACNARIKAGAVVFGIFQHKRNRRSWRERDEDLWEDWKDYFRVESLSRDRQKVRLSYPLPSRTGWQYPRKQYYMDEGRQCYGHGGWGDWPVNKRGHVETKIKNVFNCEAYQKGDYKTFLCDGHTKGAYLQWAPFLLAAERFHKMTDERKSEI